MPTSLTDAVVFQKYQGVLSILIMRARLGRSCKENPPRYTDVSDDDGSEHGSEHGSEDGSTKDAAPTGPLSLGKRDRPRAGTGATKAVASTKGGGKAVASTKVYDERHNKPLVFNLTVEPARPVDDSAAATAAAKLPAQLAAHLGRGGKLESYHG